MAEKAGLSKIAELLAEEGAPLARSQCAR